MLVKTWQICVYFLFLIISSTLSGMFLEGARTVMDNYWIDVMLCFVIMYLLFSIISEPFATLTVVEDKLQLLIDLLVHVCKAQHTYNHHSYDLTERSFFEDFKSDGNVDVFQKKYT